MGPDCPYSEAHACTIDMVADGAVLAPPAPPNSPPKGAKMSPTGQEGSDMSEWLPRLPKKFL